MQADWCPNRNRRLGHTGRHWGTIAQGLLKRQQEGSHQQDKEKRPRKKPNPLALIEPNLNLRVPIFQNYGK